MKPELVLSLLLVIEAGWAGAQEPAASDVTARVEAWRKELKSTDAKVRKTAIRELGKLGPRAAAAAPDLVALLSDRALTEARSNQPKGLMRYRIVPMLLSTRGFVGELPEAIRRIGGPVVPVLTAALDRDDHVSTCALNILEAIGPEAAPAVPVIHALLTNGTKERRIAAIRALGGIGPTARIAIPTLKTLYAERPTFPVTPPYDLGGEFSLEAAHALVFVDRGFVNRELDSPDAVSRRLVRLALSGKILGGSMHSPSPWRTRRKRLQHRAYSAVGLPDQPDLSTLLEALRGEDENARAVALASFPSDLRTHFWKPQPALKRLAAFLDDPNPIVRRAVVSWLPSFEADRNRASRLAGTRIADSDVRVRRAAFRALRRLDARLYQRAVQEAVEDEDEQVAVEAIHILARLARPPDGSVPNVPIEPFLAAARPARPIRVRAAALEALGTLGYHYRNVPVPASLLLGALDDPSPMVRRAALSTLCRRMNHDQLDAAFSRALELLGDADAEVRFQAVELIAHTESRVTEAEAELRKLAQDPESRVGRRAAAVVRAIESRRASRAAALRDATSGDRSTRIRALKECTELGPEGFSLLINALGAADETVRAMAANYLNRLQFAPQLLAELEETKDWRVRVSIIEILAWLTHDTPGDHPREERMRVWRQVARRQELVLRTIQDERPEVRRVAVWLVGNFARKFKTLDCLFRSLRDPDRGVRDNAFHCLRQLSEPKWPLTRMIDALENLDESDWTSRLVLREFCVRGAKAASALPALIDGLRRAPGRLRADFALAVGMVGGERAAVALPDIRRLLHDENPAVRGSAAGGLGAIGPPARQCLPELIRMAREDSDRSARFLARKALGQIARGTEEVVPTLIRMLSETETKDRGGIIRTLGDIGADAREAIPVLETIAQDGKWDFLSRCAGEALRKIRAKPTGGNAGRTQCVSGHPTAKRTLQGHCWNPALSGDGRFVAFDSDAAGLLEKSVPSGHVWKTVRQVYVFDRVDNTLTLVSVSSNGEPGNRESQRAAISTDGRIVAFESRASNLVPGDHNQRMDVFVHDRKTRRTTRVSVSSSGEQGSELSDHASLSGDGRFVAFTSRADNFLDDDDNRTSDVFVHDRNSGRTECVSVDAARKAAGGFRARISADGNFVVYVGGPTRRDPGQGSDRSGIQLRDLRAKTTRWIAAGDYPSVSADGRFVAYRRTDREGVLPGPEDSGVFVHDVKAGVTTTIYYARNPARTSELGPTVISADGQRVAFASHQTSLVKGDTNGVMDVFVYDQRTKSVLRASVSSAGHQANATSHTAAISGGGRFVAFVCFDDYLVEGDRNRAPDILVRRLD